MLHIARWASVVGCVGLFTVEADACGPCTDPLLLELEQGSSGLVVVSNFGLLEKTDDAWRVICEEHIGGLILDVDSDQERTFVSSDTGLHVQDGDLCGWVSGPASASNDWFVSFSAAPSADDEPRVPYALVVDPDTDELLVQVSDGDQMNTIGRFPNDVGYRDILAAGNPAGIFVAGYSFNPRTWNLGYSTDGGETWDQATPEIADEYSTAVVRLIDPEHPEAVFVEVETPVGQADELWLFDATVGEAELLLTLEDGELMTGIALGTDAVWVAGSRRGGGSIYKAARGDLSFTRVSDSAPVTDCLTEADGMLYACVNDFTASSQYIIGVSDDEGVSWAPYLTLREFGQLETCGKDCEATVQWLQSAYGASPATDAGATPSERDETADAGDDDDGEVTIESDADEGDAEPPKKGGGGCTLSYLGMASSKRISLFNAGAGLLALGLMRRRQQRLARSRRNLRHHES